MESTATFLVLIDGECILCDGFAKFVAQHDREGVFIFETQQSNAGQQILKIYDLPLDLKTILLVETVGKTERCYQKSTAVLRILSRLSAPYWCAGGCLYLPAVLRDWVYDRVAERRYGWFGKKESCSLPDAVIKERLMRRLND